MTRLIGKGRRCGGLNNGTTKRRSQIGSNVAHLNAKRRSKHSCARNTDAPLTAFYQAKHTRRDTHLSADLRARTATGHDVIGDFHRLRFTYSKPYFKQKCLLTESFLRRRLLALL